MKVTLNDIQDAQKILQSHISLTPLNFSSGATHWLKSQVYFKQENEQRTGSFKIRGALNKVLSLSREEQRRGLVASSAGNHAQGVAFSASKVGTSAHVVMPISSSLNKIAATQSYGAEVLLKGNFYDEAYAYARELEQKHGYIFVHAFEDEKIIAGQGTIGLEILAQIPDLDSIFIPMGGGGLVAGIATVVKALRPECKVYAVVSDQAAGMKNLFFGQEHHKPTNPPVTIADGIAVKTPSKNMFDSFIHRLVDDIIAVSDDEIAEAIVWLLERAKTVVEGSAATVLAAAAQGKVTLGRKTCLILSGGNIDLNIISMVVNRGLSRKGRLARLSIIVPDRPGMLQSITNSIAEQRANILEVKHDRLAPDLHLGETAIEFLLEVRSHQHIDQIRHSLATTNSSAKILQI
ncbi:MAG: threonine ammonia-lyase [Bdellovibrionales bacterium]|nr:threonine ammonia-lyase [Bdellovibrionales bacterium]